MSRHLRYFVPLIIFAVIGVFLFRGLYLDPSKIPSVLINKPVPEFKVPRLKTPDQTISPADLKGKIWLLNVWATWCVSCRAEHEVLMELARSGKVDIYGLNYKDENAAALAWLRQLGDPYVANAVDADGRIGIDLGVYGTPESFLIDANGVIRYKHIGPISFESLRNEVLPEIEKLKAESP